jgi:hypothetical protein
MRVGHHDLSLRDQRIETNEMTDLTFLSGREKMIEAIEAMKVKALRGEIGCSAFRLFKPDGSWEDLAAGGTPEQREQLLFELKTKLREQVAAPMGQAANDAVEA